MHWDVQESLEELKRQAAEMNLNTTVPDYIEARQKQILVMRILHKMIAPETEIRYEPTGKPVLYPHGHISFSHSTHHIVVYKSANACGVDLEQLNERVLRIRHKYINETEQKYLTSESVDDLIRLWSAKEAMFKVYGRDGVFLRNNIFVEQLSAGGCIAKLVDGDVEMMRQIPFKVIDNMILAWTETITEDEGIQEN